MIRNTGTLDRVLRAFLVAPVSILVALSLGAGTVAGFILFVFAGIMLAVAVTGFCPLYVLLGISTYPEGMHRVGHHIRHGHA